MLPPQSPTIPHVLSIAGTDPSGGAGTAADVKSISAAGGYGMAVVTSLVAQNTHGVRAIHTPPVEFFREQLAAMADDVYLDAIKIGMVGTQEYLAALVEWLRDAAPRAPWIVVDPVMVASSGDSLAQGRSDSSLAALIAAADVVTPNIPELAVLAGLPEISGGAGSTSEPREATDLREALAQGKAVAAAFDTTVVVKTGHLSGADAGNTAVFPDGTSHHAASRRVETTATHGTGCSLSSALAARLAAQPAGAQASSAVSQALDWATEWLHGAIAAGEWLGVGRALPAADAGIGHGPVDHFWRLRGVLA